MKNILKFLFIMATVIGVALMFPSKKEQKKIDTSNIQMEYLEGAYEIKVVGDFTGDSETLSLNRNGGAVYLYIDNVNGEAVVDQRIEGTWTAVGETLRTNFKGVTETFVNKNGVYTSKVSEKRTLVKIP